MHSYPVDLVTLDDGTTWLRRGDVMIRATLPVEAAWPGVTPPSPAPPAAAAQAVAVAEPAAPSRTPRALGPGKGQKRMSPHPRIPLARQPAPSQPRYKVDEAKVLKAKRLYETTNTKLNQIAEEVDLKYQTLYGIATREKWTRQALVGRPS